MNDHFIVFAGIKIWYDLKLDTTNEIDGIAFKIHGSYYRPHRKNGPAMIFPNGEERYYINGKKHREDGPAEFSPNKCSWYLNDLVYCFEEYCFILDKTDDEKRFLQLKYGISNTRNFLIDQNGNKIWYDLRSEKCNREENITYCVKYENEPYFYIRPHGSDYSCSIITPNKSYYCYVKGKKHSEYFPAEMHKDGTYYWYLNDIEYSFEDWCKELNLSDEQIILATRLIEVYYEKRSVIEL